MSELDKWFPRDDPPEVPPDKQPDNGVIDGVKRNQPKRYARRWYQIIRKEKTDAHKTG